MPASSANRAKMPMAPMRPTKSVEPARIQHQLARLASLLPPVSRMKARTDRALVHQPGGGRAYAQAAPRQGLCCQDYRDTPELFARVGPNQANFCFAQTKGQQAPCHPSGSAQPCWTVQQASRFSPSGSDQTADKMAKSISPNV